MMTTTTAAPPTTDIDVIIIPCCSRLVPPAFVEICKGLEARLKDEGIRVAGDYRDAYLYHWKYMIYEEAGVPIRIELHERDVMSNRAALVHSGKRSHVVFSDLCDEVKSRLSSSVRE